MVRFIIVRHGYSIGNKSRKFSGQWDVPLDEIGYEQAESVCEYISKNFEIDGIYSSDLCRAYDTVKPLGEALGMEIKKCRELREVDVGLWQGKFIEDVEKEFPDGYKLYRENAGLSKFDGGESFVDLMNRGRDIFEKIALENDEKTIVVGTHGGVIRTLRAAWNGIAPENIKDIPQVPNASVTIALYEGNGKVTWEKIGDASHLVRVTEEVFK